MSVDQTTRSTPDVSAPRTPQTRPASMPENQRVIVERVRPQVDGGRFAIKRTPEEPVEVVASIFADGHDRIAAVLQDRAVPSDADWREARMTPVAFALDEWSATFAPAAVGWHEYRIV